MAKKKQISDETAPAGSGPLDEIDVQTSFSIASDEDSPIIIKPGSNEMGVENPTDRTMD